MKYSLNMLKRYIAINDTPDTIANHLITKTVEIEDIKTRAIPESIVIGKITKVEKHPDADKLNVCMVNCGNKGTFQIICGGSNVREHIYVPTALVGTYFSQADLKIEPRIMRGIESNGMICAKSELEINEDLDTHGIWDMEKDFNDLSDDDLGTPLVQKYERLNNTILDADNKGLTHRPDLTGHFGLGIELRTIYGYHHPDRVKFDTLKQYFELFKDADILQVLEGANRAKIDVECQTNALNSYIAIAINAITVKQSDFFTRLEMLDLDNNPISNWVDFSNLFMQLSGQPVHFFDADKIKGKIIVRNAHAGEIFVDLFEKEHSLVETDIVIADEEKILALGGVVGGLDSGVNASTKNIIVEIANFDPVAVRKTGVRLGLRTDAELRFEKTINPVYSLQALHLFLDQLNFYKKDLGNFDLGGISYYIKDGIFNRAHNSITIESDTTAKFIYGEKKADFAAAIKIILHKLGCEIDGDESITVKTPLRRSPDDLVIKADLYEEIARIIGYETIETKPLLQTMDTISYPQLVQNIRIAEKTLVQKRNYDQIETYPWIGEKQIKNFEVTTENLYSIQNPIDVQFPYMRDSMVYGLLQAVAKNSKFFDSMAVFDIGKIWNKELAPTKNTDSDRGTYASGFVGECSILGMMRYHNKKNHWEDDPLLAMKADIQLLLKQLKINGKLEYQATKLPFAHPKKQADILFNRKKIGKIYTLHPSIFGDYKVSDESQICYAELDLQAIENLQAQSKSKIKHYETLQDQIVWRDLCFVVDGNKDFSGIIDTTKKIREVEDLEVFDIYEGEHLPEGKKSLAFKFKIKGENLKTEEINAIMEKIIEKVENTGAKLR